ncbi:MAG: hypothetical protein ABIZ82_00075 [Candidatus Tumulicola sp.]
MDLTTRQTAPRFGAMLIVLALVAMIAFLPSRYHLVPEWVGYTAMSLMLLAMILVWITQQRPWLLRLGRVCEFAAVATALALNSANLLVTAYNLVENPSKLEAVPLFYTSIGIWVGNILIFTLIYWLVDGGGPDARLNHTNPYPDFDFPGLNVSAPVRPNWQPGIVDYLFLGFTTSTAFSPTEAMPMTPRAKLLVMLQSTISLATIAIVAARTINILG